MRSHPRLGRHEPTSRLVFVLMLLCMFSMAGIPPLMGFYAKSAVIKALLLQGYVGLSVFSVIMSLIGAFYYLRVVKTIYFDEAEHAQPAGGQLRREIRVNRQRAAVAIVGHHAAVRRGLEQYLVTQ
nr:proton-conducting transporter membrane subunit [Neisseria iguanae]